MKKTLQITLSTSLLILAFTIISFACDAKKITLSNGTATLSGKTGTCQRFTFAVSEGQRVRIFISSTDGKARFHFENGTDDDTGTTGWGPIASIDKVVESDYWEVGVEGTSSVAYTLKITVTNE